MKEQPGSLAPPAERSDLWQHINQAARDGLFKLQVCARCDTVQYPPQDFCRHCLNDALPWEQVSAMGTVLSWTRSHASTHRFFRERLPLRVGMIKLDCGPTLVTWLDAASLRTGNRVRVVNRADKSGQAVFFAITPGTDPATEFSTLLEG